MNVEPLEFGQHLIDVGAREIDAGQMSDGLTIVFIFDGVGDLEHTSAGVGGGTSGAARDADEVGLEIGKMIERVVDDVDGHILFRRKHFKRKHFTQPPVLMGGDDDL